MMNGSSTQLFCIFHLKGKKFLIVIRHYPESLLDQKHRFRIFRYGLPCGNRITVRVAGPHKGRQRRCDSVLYIGCFRYVDQRELPGIVHQERKVRSVPGTSTALDREVQRDLIGIYFSALGGAKACML